LNTNKLFFPPGPLQRSGLLICGDYRTSAWFFGIRQALPNKFIDCAGGHVMASPDSNAPQLSADNEPARPIAAQANESRGYRNGHQRRSFFNQHCPIPYQKPPVRRKLNYSINSR
jgi:hypothetical protein